MPTANIKLNYKDGVVGHDKIFVKKSDQIALRLIPKQNCNLHIHCL